MGFFDKADGADRAYAGGGAFAPGVDIHLVMNTFNRLAGEPWLDGSAQGDQIFNLCDYLRQSFMHMVPVEVGVVQEVALLGGYLRLAAGFRGWELDAPVTLQPEAHGLRLRAHSLCLVVQAVLCAVSPDAPGRWRLSVRIGRESGRTVGIEMQLQPLSSPPTLRLRRAQDELQSLCAALSQGPARWSLRHASRRDAGLAIQVAID